MLHAQPAHTNSQMATAVILDWSGWKSIPVLGSLHTYILHVTPWCWPCLGVGLDGMERLHTHVGAPTPEVSFTCPVGIGIREDSYVI